jgi:predicted membrane-bound spermidine synthase
MPAFAVAAASAAGMALEIAFARAAGPFLGTSTETWAAIIAVSLAALAIGAWVGGTVADREDPERSLAIALGAAALLVGLGVGVRDQILTISLALSAMAGSLFTGATVAALVVLAPATATIGAVSPIAARLSLVSLGRTGRTMGRLSAAGAGGSVVGTVIAGAFALPYLGTANTFTAVAVALTVAAAIVAARRWREGYVWLAVGLGALGSLIALGSGGTVPLLGVVADVDTRYARVLVTADRDRSGRATLALATDPFGTQCAGYRDEEPGAATSSLPFEYTRWLDLGDELSAASGTGRSLVIGGCNLSFPRHLVARGRSVDVFEIDPGMTRLAREYFGASIDDPNLAVTHGDARVLVGAATTTYRFVALDAFGSFSSTPYHLATAQFFASLRERVAPGGALAMNVIGAREGEAASVTAAILASVRAAFPRAALLYKESAPADAPQNLIVLAWNGEGPDGDSLAAAAARHGLAVASAEDLARLPEEPALSDDLAPMERLTAPLRAWQLARIREGLR